MNLFSQNAPVSYDNFLPTFNSILATARVFGISTYGRSIAFLWTIIVLIMLFLIEVGAIWKVVRSFNVNYSDGRALIARMSGSIFYGNALFSLILSLRLTSSLKQLSVHWIRAETKEGMRFPADPRIKKRLIYVFIVIAVCACVEHMLSMMSATGFHCPPEEYVYRYIISSHGFLLQPSEYNLWLAIPIFILSKIATMLWNFQDLIIILISMGLTSRYNRINLYVKNIVKYEKKVKNMPKLGTESYVQNQLWRRVREAYVTQAALVRLVDKDLGALMLLSNTNNLYFICLQLFLGINTKNRGTLINKIYYFVSLGWMLFRASGVVLAASDVNVHSKRALTYLYSFPETAYNIEVRRLKYQLKNDVVALSGMGFFSLKRQLLLQVAATVFKYELVLIQYDK